MENTISSEKFIELFITLKQLHFLKDSEGPNLYNLVWSFNIKLLSEFIFHCKKDYRYKEFLRCFEFKDKYSISLISELNRALQKHLLTGIYDDEAYISRYYTNYRVVEDNSEFVSIMQEFIESYDYFCLNKDFYLKNAEGFMNGELQGVSDNSRMIFDLQRRILKKYNEEEN